MKKIALILVFIGLISSCSILENVSKTIEDTLQKSDPYSENSKAKEIILEEKRIDENGVVEVEENINKSGKIQDEDKLGNIEKNEKINENTKSTNYTEELKEKIKKKIDKKFDKTDEKIVNFIAEKVHEDADKIKEITMDGIAKLMAEKNIKMSKREFLARTYQIIKENNMTSYYLAAGRLLNQVKK